MPAGILNAIPTATNAIPTVAEVVYELPVVNETNVEIPDEKIAQESFGIIEDKYDDDVAQCLSILYGGSCKPSNAEEIFSKEDVDGGLIGGASLNFSDFHSIIKAANG